MPKRMLAPLDQIEPRRICVIKPSALGDVVQALPVLAGLRARWPAADIAWVINRSLAELLAGHPELDRVLEFDRAGRALGRVARAASLSTELRRARFDLTIDLQGLLRSGFMTLATWAPRRVGMNTAREGARLAYTDTINVPTEMPAVERYWLVAKALGCPGSPPTPKLGIRQSDHAWAALRLASLPRPVLMIHPGARWETKRWPPKHFAELARRARQSFGAGVVLVGAPDDLHRCATIAAALEGNCVNLAGQAGLLQLAALCAAADVFLSGDTGPMHMAAAVGTPVVGVFTCTSTTRAGPYGAGHRVVATGVSCAASYLKMCPTLACMQELGADRVWPALVATLGEAVERARARAAI